LLSEENVPPYTNRGAQNTSEGDLIACVDWLQATLFHTSNPYEVIGLLALNDEDFQALETGKYGYPFQLRFHHIAIYYGPGKEHCHLEMTGQGCRQYEQLQKFEWSVLFSLLLELKSNITRLDLAIDDFKGYFKVATLYRKLKSGHARSKFKSFRYMVAAKIASKEITGQTVYLGSPQSKLMFRFYDKLAERLSKNFEIEDGLTCWNRTELQLRDARAQAAATLIATEKYNLGDMVSGILKNYINFLNPTKDSNKARWPVAKFWDKFLGDVAPLTLTEKAPDRTLEQVKSWYDKNMTPTFAMLYDAFGDDPDLFYNWIKEGYSKMGKRHRNLLDDYKTKKNLNQNGQDSNSN
jgi:phage replication initiation protein